MRTATVQAAADAYIAVLQGRAAGRTYRLAIEPVVEMLGPDRVLVDVDAGQVDAALDELERSMADPPYRGRQMVVAWLSWARSTGFEAPTVVASAGTPSRAATPTPTTSPRDPRWGRGGSTPSGNGRR
jgi:hypothetical protein